MSRLSPHFSGFQALSNRSPHLVIPTGACHSLLEWQAEWRDLIFPGATSVPEPASERNSLLIVRNQASRLSPEIGEWRVAQLLGG